jgi:hypothetical protein
MNDLSPEGCYVVLHMGTGPSYKWREEWFTSCGAGRVIPVVR